MALGLDDVPDQSGKVVIITGSSSGIGLECTRMLVAKGAHVVMACRSLEKANPLADEINESGPGKATVLRVDTTDLDSIDTFASELSDAGIVRIDALLLNAGIMMTPYKEIPTRSSENPKMEGQMACNVVGHWYLAHLLLPVVQNSPGCRVITVSSIAAEQTKGVNYDAFLCKTGEAGYDKIRSYSDSKLGDLLLAQELQRRYKAAAIDAKAYGAHPGYSNTSLQGRAESSLMLSAFMLLFRPFRMPADGGGKVLTLAAGLPDEKLPEKPYFVPNGFQGLSGAPKADGKYPPPALDEDAMKKLWETCEEFCAVKSSI